MFDLIIKNGTVIDGTGKSRFYSDIAIKEGNMSAIGDLKDVEAEAIIDATGKIVCPGYPAVY